MISEFAQNWCTESLKYADHEYQLYFRMRLLKPLLKASASQKLEKQDFYPKNLYSSEFHENWWEWSDNQYEERDFLVSHAN